MASIIYALCALTSACCLILLMRAYFMNKTPLILWSACCFLFLTGQSAILFVDLVIAPQVNLALIRTVAGFIGPCILLSSLIWERP